MKRSARPFRNSVFFEMIINALTNKRPANSDLRRSFGGKPPWAVFIFVIIANLAPDPAQSETELRLGTVAPSGSPWGEWVQGVADEIEHVSEGALRINVIGDAALGEEKTILRQGMRGRLDMVMTSNIYLSLIRQEMGLVSSPYLFDSIEQGSCVAYQHMSSILGDAMDEAQLVPLSWLEVGNMIVFSNDPVTTPSDLEGKKVRISETSADMLFSKKLGAVGVPLGISDTVLSLQTGNVDAAFLPAVFGIGIGVHKIVPHLTVSNHSRLIGIIAISKPSYDRLSPQEKEWLEIVTSSGPELSATILEAEKALIGQLSEAGVPVKEFTGEEKEEWRAFADGLQAELAQDLGEDAVRLLAKIEAAKAACDG